MSGSELESNHENLKYSVNRKVLMRDELEEMAGYNRSKDTFRNQLRKIRCMSLLYDFCPVLRWLPKYQIRDFLMGDIIAGITVAVMHIPQGMAYGLLSGVDAIVGLYLAFFPTLIYFLFGTSRHISMGTFAIVSLLTSKVVAKYSETSQGYTYTPFEVGTAVTMVTGLYHLVMYVMRLGTLSSLLSEALVNGFTTAASRNLRKINFLLSN
jgi:solute carrier family 26, other